MKDITNYCLKIQKAKAKLTEFKIQEDRPNFPINSNNLDYYSSYVLSRYAEEYYKDHNSIRTKKIYSILSIASEFFDVSEQTNDRPYYNWDFLLTAACAYFLSDNFGSAKVMIEKIDVKEIADEYSFFLNEIMNYVFFNSQYETYKNNLFNILIEKLDMFLIGKEDKEAIEDILVLLEKKIQKIQEENKLFFASIILAIVKKIINCSSINLLPIYTEISINIWKDELQLKNCPKLLWQAQRLIGESGVFKEKDGIIQLPTGVGKTKSIELIVRSAFISERSNTIVIVAPLRSLCNEIVNDLSKVFVENVVINKISDVLQQDFFFDFDLDSKNIIVCTPEKLSFLLYHAPETCEIIDLFVFDEVHMFDDKTRGTQYELLLTLINKINKQSQKILISAVFPNIEELNNWFLDGEGAIVNSENIKTTMKSNAFVSLQNEALMFFDKNYKCDYDYYIPRFLLNTKLNTMKRNEKPKNFPDRSPKDVALYLALKLCSEGATAIYVDRVATLHTSIKQLQFIKDRGYNIDALNMLGDSCEKNKLCNLIKNHYGENELFYGAQMGVFAHYSNLEMV